MVWYIVQWSLSDGGAAENLCVFTYIFLVRFLGFVITSRSARLKETLPIETNEVSALLFQKKTPRHSSPQKMRHAFSSSAVMFVHCGPRSIGDCSSITLHLSTLSSCHSAGPAGWGTGSVIRGPLQGTRCGEGDNDRDAADSVIALFYCKV